MTTSHNLLTGLTLATTLAPVLASVYIPNIHARQETDDGSSGDFSDVSISLSDTCQTAIDDLVPLYSEAPTAPAVLATATAIPADPCAATADFSGTELSEWESYTSAAMGWYSSHSEAIDSALSSCSELSDYYGGASMPVCTDVPLVPTAVEGLTTTDVTATSDGVSAGITGGSSISRKASSAVTATVSSDATGESSASTTTTATEAAAPAPRETGVMVAAAAVVAAGACFLL